MLMQGEETLHTNNTLRFADYAVTNTSLDSGL